MKQIHALVKHKLPLSPSNLKEKKFGLHRLYKICLFSGLIYFKQFSHYKCFKISFVGCFYDSAALPSKLNDKCLLGLDY